MRVIVRVLGIAAAVLLATAIPASGQARLLSSTPEDGQSFERLSDIEFEFDVLLVPEGAEITVTKLDGTSFPVETSVDATFLRGVVVGDLPSGNYEVGYRVRSADGAVNEGAIRVGVDAPEQALSGGLLAVIAVFGALCVYMAIVFRADKRRRPDRRRGRGDGEIAS